ncbi:peroxiredoxin family protein [Paludisphaera soli]|uniref:peroxiredoxin family protein n=1 Tax=Paludisphaera soli TaxID=2712865 RepID=UPI0013EC5C65|nr:peroxiredoxin family protein [Paludisphaera soli]
MTLRLGLSSIVLLALAPACLAAAPPRKGEPATDFALKTLGGETVESKSLREKGPVVLVVLRGWPGYQCPACSAQVADLIRNAGKFEARKARVVLVYPGPADGLKAHAAEFEGGKGLPAGFQLVMDPDYSFTEAYGLRWDEAGETAYPSTFVIRPDGKVAYAKVSRSHGGRAKAGEVLEALGGE